jgi:hypothetical protein
MKRYASKFFFVFLALSLGLVISSEANAQLSIDFSTDGGINFGDDLNLTVGDTASVGVYLTDLDPNSRIAILGLQSFALNVVTDSTVSSITNATLQSPYEAVAGGGTFQTDGSFVWEASVPDTTPPTDAPRGFQILLGNFDVIGSGVGQSVFTATDINPDAAGWRLGERGDSADKDIFGEDETGTFSFTTNVVAVPEPSSTLIGLGLIAFGASRRRRR